MTYFYSTIGGLLIGGFSYFIAPKIANRALPQCSVRVQAKITDFTRKKHTVDPVDNNSSSSEIYLYHPIFTYEYGGRTYTATSIQACRFKPLVGSSKKIRIDPNDPTRVAFASSETILFKAFGILMFAVSILSFFKSFVR